MIDSSHNGQMIKLWTPGDYLIEVAGEVDSKMAGRLGGIRIISQRGMAKAKVTTLTGRLTDQAELVGVLNSLYEMHFPILKVKRLSDR